jgi:DNA-binding FadR family transcriptional regulator
MKTPRPASVARRIANVLREEAFRLEDGTLLGTEDELLRRFGLSRNTFRQAAKLLEQEQLLRIRRGVGGGYFVQRPTAQAVAHVTAIYLHARRASLQHLIATSAPLYVATAGMAARRADPAQVALLRDFVEGERAAIDTPMSQADYLRSERRFGEIFHALSANPVLDLFIEIVFDLSKMQSESVWTDEPERIQQSRRMRLRLGEAILDGEAEMAQIAARRWCGAIADWFEADHGAALHRLMSPSQDDRLPAA